jgi:hypothetical protein
VLLDGLLGHLDGRRRLFGSTTTLASISEEQAQERTQEHEDWVGGLNDCLFLVFLAYL